MPRVAVTDVAPVFTRGIESALIEAGYEVIHAQGPEDLASSDAVLASVSSERWLALRTMGVRLVALIESGSIKEYATAFALGASGAVPLTGDADLIISAIESALVGLAVVPSEVAQALAVPTLAEMPDDLVMTDTELNALRALSKGTTVYAIANQHAYSEREMYRILHGLYLRMGVRNRAEAIAKAAQWGLLGTSDSESS